jgi:hypothetical protein
MELRQDRVTLEEFILAVRQVRFDHPLVDGASVKPATKQLIANHGKQFTSLPLQLQNALAAAEVAAAQQAEDAALAFQYFMQDYRNPPEEALTHLVTPYSVSHHRWLTLEEVRLLIDKLKLNHFARKAFPKI